MGHLGMDYAYTYVYNLCFTVTFGDDLDNFTFFFTGDTLGVFKMTGVPLSRRSYTLTRKVSNLWCVIYKDLLTFLHSLHNLTLPGSAK